MKVHSLVGVDRQSDRERTDKPTYAGSPRTSGAKIDEARAYQDHSAGQCGRADSHQRRVKRAHKGTFHKKHLVRQRFRELPLHRVSKM